MKWLLVLIFVSIQLSAQDNNFRGATGYVPDEHQQAHAPKRSYMKKHFKGGREQTLPEEYDLRKVGNGIASVRDQGSCGSCWWFGTSAILEDLVSLRDGKQIEISKQWGIDCKPARYYGCGGGDFAFAKLMPGYGAIYESEYPLKYTASNGTCQTDWLKGNHWKEQVVDWALIDNNVEGMQRAMYDNEMPLGVTVGSRGLSPGADGWQESCRTASTDHIVTIVGWLRGEKHGHAPGVYWILKNSWGKRWGDKGYLYILARKNGTVCASLGVEEVAAVNYKSRCVEQPFANAGEDKSIILEEN